MAKGFFDRLEDNVRGFLSHYPIPYAIIGGIGIVLFWRGVWHGADYLMLLVRASAPNSTISLSEEIWWDGPLSLVAGTALLLTVGLFVSNFIGNEIIISGLRGEKKLSEKTEREVETEFKAIADIKRKVSKISDKIKA